LKPVLALTAGDPAGIGPEIALAAVRDGRVRRACSPLLVGPRGAFQRHGWRPSLCPVLDPGVSCPDAPGRPTIEGGAASYAAARLALAFASRGLVGGFVTGPISKESWKRAGAPFNDHTELIQRELGAPAAMMLMAGRLRAVLATRHMPLSEVARSLDARGVVESARVLRAGLRLLGVPSPRIALCALNPHAGEGGLLGTEERRILAPAAARLRRLGLRARGPLPADAAWSLHRLGGCDGLVCLYHDQAQIPLKMASPYGVVNWTLGIPFARTSPGHGTAFDIAGKRRADPGAMIAAALWAARLARRGTPLTWR